MKTSKAYYEKFKAEFVKWQKELGLTQYRVVFYHKPLSEHYATMEITETGKHVSVILCTNIKEPENDPGPEIHARHEVAHLLIHRLSWLGGSRYITDDDLAEECEAVVVRLEKVWRKY